MDVAHLMLPLLMAFAVGGGFYAVFYPLLSGNRQGDKRKAALQSRAPVAMGSRIDDAVKRRKQVSDSLKEFDARKKSTKLTFDAKIAQAGLNWTKRTFYLISAILGLVGAGLGYLASNSPLTAACIALVAGVGLPNWILTKWRDRRLKRFLAEFPTAIDMIVRGVKAGIPLGDCLRNIANEAAEPVKSEFRTIVEAQTMGLTIPEAVERLIDRVPTAEVNFFSIVLTIQAKAGGNLAEALANLSNVLRDRKKMKGKIKAMSSEAKASAGIIGALPPLVTFFVYLTSPSYISLLFTTSTGHIVLGVCAVWMGTGVLVMKKMINFDM